MKLNSILTSAGSFFGNVGCLRLSVFYTSKHASQGVLVQKVARAVMGGFILLGAYDFVSHSLSYGVRIIVVGSLVLLVSSFALSLLLKGVQKLCDHHAKRKNSTNKGSSIPSKDEIVDQSASSLKKSSLGKQAVVKVKTVISPVKRNLLSEFEAAAKE